MRDAWKQYYDLLETYTQEWLPRQDLRVTGLGCDRTVRLEIGKRRPSDLDKFDEIKMGRYDWTVTQRNVSTMRELAAAIISACDFVDNVNPVWAAGHRG